MATRAFRRGSLDDIYSPEAREALRKYKGTMTDYDADGVTNKQDVDPYNPSTRQGPTLPGYPNLPPKKTPITQNVPMGQQVVDKVTAGILAQADAQEAQANKREYNQRAGAMDQFYNQMMQIMQRGAPTPMSYMGPSNEELRSRSQMIAGAQFDPQIEAIRRMMGETQTRANTNNEQLGLLYSALAREAEADIPEVQQTYQTAIDQQNQQQAALQQALTADYGARTSAIDELAAQLGQQDTAAAANEQIAADQAFLQNLERQIGASQAGALQQMQAVNTEYTRQGAGLARQEGANRRTDLMEELESYLRQREGDITGLTSQREATAAASLAEMLAQADQARQQVSMQNTSMMNDWRNTQWSQMMDLFQMRQAMDKALQPQGPSASDMLGAQRLDFDQEQAMRQWVLDLTKDLKGQERIDAINFYMQQLGIR